MVPMTGTSPEDEDNRLSSPNQQGRNLAWSGHSSHAGRQAAGGRGWRPQAGMPPGPVLSPGGAVSRGRPLYRARKLRPQAGALRGWERPWASVISGCDLSGVSAVSFCPEASGYTWSQELTGSSPFA